jgi:hypothetical protein
MKGKILLAFVCALMACKPFVAMGQSGKGAKESEAAPEADESEDLMKLLDEGTPQPKRTYTSATFKTTRLINGHTVENTGKGVLDMKISHRFSRLGNGARDLFGLDGATIRLGLDYGLTDRLTVGVGRSSYEKEYDGFLKLKVVRQSDAVPVTVSYLGSTMLQTMPANVLPTEIWYFSNRMCFANELLIARKVNSSISLQLMPTHIHYNLVDKKTDPNDVIAIGGGGRVKLSKRVSLNAEYFYVLPGFKQQGTVNSLSIGFDIETGGHVFQLHFTNSTGMTERTYVGRTTEKWTDGGMRFGFNVSRVFTVRKPKEFKGLENKMY